MEFAKSTSIVTPVNDYINGYRKIVDELSNDCIIASQVNEIGSQKHLITSIEANKIKLLIVELIGVENEISSQDLNQLKEETMTNSLMMVDSVIVFHLINRKPSEDEASSFFHRGVDDWIQYSSSSRLIKTLIDVLSSTGPCIDYKKISSLELQTSESCVTDLFEALLKDCTEAKSKVFQIGPEGTDCALKSVSCDLHVCSQILGSPYLYQLCEFVNARIQQGPPWSKFFQEIVYQGLEKLTSELNQLQVKRPRFRFF